MKNQTLYDHTQARTGIISFRDLCPNQLDNAVTPGSFESEEPKHGVPQLGIEPRTFSLQLIYKNYSIQEKYSTTEPLGHRDLSLTILYTWSLDVHIFKSFFICAPNGNRTRVFRLEGEHSATKL